MHQEAWEYVRAAAEGLGAVRSVVELGGRNVNGGVRRLFRPDARYCAVDIQPGVGVDAVADAADFAPLFRPEVVICCEVLEHTPRAREIVLNAARMLAPGGTLILTAACAPRAPHAGIDGGDLRSGEFYRNVDPLELEAWLAEAGFRTWTVDVLPRGDVRATARRARDFAVEPLRVYAVVAALNALERMRELEAALAAATVPLRPIFIDNGSDDGTREWLLTLPRDGPVVLLNERNVGAAGAWNCGLRYAFDNGAEAVLVVGHDAVPEAGAVERLVRLAEAGIGFVTGTAVGKDGARDLEDEGPAGALADDADFTAFLMSRELHDALAAFERGRGLARGSDEGLFDSRFHPAYCEDDDFLVRLRRAGLPAYRDPAALFRHDVSLAFKNTPVLLAAGVELTRRSAARFETKWGFPPNKSEASKRRPLNVSAEAWEREYGERDGRWSDEREAVAASKRAVGRRFRALDLVSDVAPAAPPLAAEPHDRPVPARLPRGLWCSNAPTAPTGYGQQTKLFVPRLVRKGLAMAVHCLYGMDYGAMRWEGVPCLPRGAHPLGQDLVAAHAERFDADFVVTLLDVWPLEPETFARSASWLPWTPVDHEPLSERVRAKLALARTPIAMSRNGEAAMRAAGLRPAYIPHGVDTRVFAPADRAAARAAVGLPANAFVFGMVAANKDVPSRKAFPQCFRAFAEIKRRVPEALLYVHAMDGAAPGRGTVDLRALADASGAGRAIRIADQYSQLTGCSEAHMANLYNAFDVLLSPSFGEGFGIPILEAQACGTAVVVGGWTAMPELCFAGEVVDKEDADPFWTQLNAWQFAPRPEAIARAALRLRDRILQGEDLRGAARRGAAEFDADLVVERYWMPLLTGLEGAAAKG